MKPGSVMNRTTTINVRSQLLKPYRQVAKILGIPVASYLETHLQPFLDNLEENSLSYIAEEFCCRSYPSRKSAEAAAERFEAYAIAPAIVVEEAFAQHIAPSQTSNPCCCLRADSMTGRAGMNPTKRSSWDN
jgi:hypothetical protein